MIDKKPSIAFEGIGLSPEQRAFVNAVVTGKGFSNPLDDKLRSMYDSVVEYLWVIWNRCNLARLPRPVSTKVTES